MTEKTLSQALVAAQKAFGPALKTANNPHFKSRYADLAAVVEAVIDGLNDNGIYLFQRTIECETGVKIETIFIHESGEERSMGIVHMPVQRNDAQAYGSALTYARRYSLMAACGVAPEDDDGNQATAKPAPQVKKTADYSTYEKEKLEILVEAATHGIESLTEAFKSIPASAEKAQFWKDHGSDLKNIANGGEQ